MSHCEIDLDRYTAVGWDFDGTMADTVAAHYEARVRAFEEHGFGDIPQDFHVNGHHFGVTPQTIIGNILIQQDRIPEDTDVTTDERIRAIVTTKRAMYFDIARHGLDAKPGALELIHTIAESIGNNNAIVTNALTVEVLPFIKRHRLLQIFRPAFLISVETVLEQKMNLKPAPDPYTFALKHMGVSNPREMLTLEDSHGGAVSAHSAGTSLLVVSESLEPTSFDDCRPDYFVRSLEDVKIL